jgi:hypothetical protein
LKTSCSLLTAAVAMSLASSAGATEPDTWLIEHEDAVSDNLRVSSHMGARSRVEIWFSADNTVNVQTDCSGCLLDVRIRAWAGSDGPGRVDVRGESRAELGPQDAFRFTATETSLDVAFAWDIGVTLNTEQGVVEETHAVFGRLTKDGFHRATWDDYVIENRYAVYERDGERTVMRMAGPVVALSTEAVLEALRADEQTAPEKAVKP